MAESRHPVVVGFLCNWCAYRAADVAGVTRTPYSPALRPIRVMCSGRVEPELILKALSLGADGVLIVGCHLGGCHSVDGNVKAARRVALLRPLLAQLGVAPERVDVVWTGASEGARLAEEVDRFVERIGALGRLRLPSRAGAPQPPADLPLDELRPADEGP